MSQTTNQKRENKKSYKKQTFISRHKRTRKAQRKNVEDIHRNIHQFKISDEQ